MLAGKSLGGIHSLEGPKWLSVMSPWRTPVLQSLGMAVSLPRRRTVDLTPYFAVGVHFGLTYKHSTERPCSLALFSTPPKPRRQTSTTYKEESSRPKYPQTSIAASKAHLVVLYHCWPCPISSLGCECLSTCSALHPTSTHTARVLI